MNFDITSDIVQTLCIWPLPGKKKKKERKKKSGVKWERRT
jgi:hypothetical protein